MLKSARFRLILILTVAIISLIAIAAGLTNLQLGPGEPVKLFQSLSNFRPQGPTSITEGGTYRVWSAFSFKSSGSSSGLGFRAP